MSLLPRVIVLATGGTIAGSSSSAASTTRYHAGTVPIGALVDAVPALKQVARIESEQVAQVDSKDMSFGLWASLVDRIHDWSARSDVAGIVVTHGTDTLEETAMLLHLACDTARVPVVLTAAMRPATSLSADGALNLLDAVRVARHPDSAGKGVLVVLNQQIHAGRDAVKAHTSAVNAFVSPAAGPLGIVQDELVHYLRAPLALPGSPWEVPAEWPAVEIVASYAAPGRVMVDALAAAGVKGLVVAAAGNGSIHETLVAALADAARAGVAVVRSSRTGQGHVTVCRHPDPQAGLFASAGDLNPYKARVVLAMALARDPWLASDPSGLQRLFADI